MQASDVAGKSVMRRVLVMMLGMSVPFIATGCADVDEASERVSAPPAPVEATGDLTKGESLFQGVWQLNQYEPDSQLGTLRIENRAFYADGVHGRYAGSVSIRSGKSPAQIDFTIEDCECSYKGMTSTGIYYEEDDGAIVFAGPAPGDPRPETFNEPNEMWRMRPLDPAER